MNIEKAQAAGEIRITAWSMFGADPDIDYRVAVLSVLQMTYLRLGAYSELLRQQVAKEEKRLEKFEGPERSRQQTGLIGFRYGAAGRDGRVYVQSEEIRALVGLEAMERDRVVKYAEVAHKMGISDRLTSLAERWGDAVATRVSTMLSELNLTPAQAARVPELVGRYLTDIDVTSIGQ